jgi:hypothetical protein
MRELYLKMANAANYATGVEIFRKEPKSRFK